MLQVNGALLQLGDHILDLRMRRSVRFHDLKTRLSLEADGSGKSWREVMVEELPHLTTEKIPLSIGHATASDEVTVDALLTEVMPPGQAH